jgi:hypothetical protein
MPTTRIRPDDDIRRHRHVWLGPKGMTLPFQATYTAWGLFFVIFVGELLFEAAMPFLTVSIFPVWEFVIAMVLATLLSGVIDHDKPLRMLPRVYRQHLAAVAGAVRRRRPAATTYKPTLRVRVRTQETNR